MARKLFQLCYISSARYSMGIAELDMLLTKARRNNRDLDITGMLLYADGSFLQILEGDEYRVRALYEHICRDSRHSQIFVLHEAEVSKRQFPDWSMGFRLLDLEELSHQAGFADLLQPNSTLAEKMSARPSLAYRMLLSFSNCSSVVPDVNALRATNDCTEQAQHH
ncbi:BLUF domain-containing protein [Motiliproteus sediminis]|uniref:BLUF domain-containing protein n=1 Tax=Motiliproteus sediminis TaxID=1468178 RepID=UPI001AEF7EF0|nr:BLUF domain-containing protein [Motiliproteus sediminis]